MIKGCNKIQWISDVYSMVNYYIERKIWNKEKLSISAKSKERNRCSDITTFLLRYKCYLIQTLINHFNEIWLQKVKGCIRGRNSNWESFLFYYSYIYSKSDERQYLKSLKLLFCKKREYFHLLWLLMRILYYFLLFKDVGNICHYTEKNIMLYFVNSW